MMKDALSGRIDMIVTKSVSRFARNLIDCISWVRRLKEQNPPIPVLFEQENLNTLDSTSNIILFVLAMVAEEESHMKSEAMLLSLEWRFSRGRFMTPKLLGYDKVEVVENGIHRKKLVINEEQAQTVRLMYYMLLNGSTTAEIAETLADEYEYAYWLGYIYRYECLMHDESSRMVYGAFSEPFMRDTYAQLFAGDAGRDAVLAECAEEICRRLDSLLIGKLWK